MLVEFNDRLLCAINICLLACLHRVIDDDIDRFFFLAFSASAAWKFEVSHGRPPLESNMASPGRWSLKCYYGDARLDSSTMQELRGATGSICFSLFGYSPVSRFGSLIAICEI